MSSHSEGDRKVRKKDVTMEAEVSDMNTGWKGVTSQGMLAASRSRKWIVPSTSRGNTALPTP